jgi:hypothetical protein
LERISFISSGDIPVEKSEFLTKMEEADRDFQKEGAPIPGRAFQAFVRLAPDYDQPILGYGVDPIQYPEFEGPNLFKRICDWYQERYGDRVCIPESFPRVPVLLRGQVYLIRIPVVYGNPEVKILPLVEGLTQGMIDSLDEHEIHGVINAFKEGFALVYELDDMRFHLDPTNPSALPDPAVRILKQAIADRDTAVNSLDKRLDTNVACFHAQQHAEKMLKGFLLARNLYTEEQLRKTPFGHNLENVFEACLKASGAFADSTGDIGLLRFIPMNVRYTMLPVEPSIAVQTIWSALRIGGLSACQISGFERRYRNPKWIR